MEFLVALSTGASIEYAVTEYMYAFARAVSESPSNWLSKVSHSFVGQCFKVLGLRFNVSVKAFEQSVDHPYGEDNLYYIFYAVPNILKKVELFVDQLPQAFAFCENQVSAYNPSTPLAEEFYNLSNPLVCYLRVVSVWVRVVESIIDKIQHAENNKFLCEPLARMSFIIFQGLVKLLPEYGESFDLLNENCLLLVVLSRYGIFFDETCELILPRMLDIFENHFRLFFGSTNSALNFIYYVFSCEMTKKDSYIKSYDFLKSMLDKFAEGGYRDESNNLYLRVCTNELITDKYLVVQFEMLGVRKSNALLLSMLQYLHTLQRHLVSTEIFSQRFLEQILLILLNNTQASNSVCFAAAELYIALTERQYLQRDVFMHILVTFSKASCDGRKFTCCEQFMSSVKLYLKRMTYHFSPLQDFNLYCNCLYDRNVSNDLSLFMAHFVFALFEQYANDYSEQEHARKQIHTILGYWPCLIQRLANHPARVVIFGIYSAVDFSVVSQYQMNLLCVLERCSLKIFLMDEMLSEAEFAFLFKTICRSVEVTGNENLLVSASQQLQYQYAEISASMMECEYTELLTPYGQCVRRIYALLKQNKLRGHQACHMYEKLASEMLHSVVTNKHLALYGYECLALMLTLVHLEREELEDAEEHERKCANLADGLLEVCLQKLRNPICNLAETKSLFCAIVILQTGMQHSMPLNAHTYAILSTQLSDSTIARKVAADSLLLRYVQEMHFLFRQMHEVQPLELPKNRIWKALLQYKIISTRPDYISPELEKLIIVLIENHISTYAHSLTVIQLHIENVCFKTNRIAAALSSHINLVERHASAKDAWLLRFHVFTSTLKSLVNRISVLRRSRSMITTRNHLLALRHLFLLVNTLLLEESHFVIISRLLGSLRKTVFTTKDAMELNNFITQISAHKISCEDEVAIAMGLGAERNKLQPEPPGPMTMRQTQAYALCFEERNMEHPAGTNIENATNSL